MIYVSAVDTVILFFLEILTGLYDPFRLYCQSSVHLSTALPHKSFPWVYISQLFQEVTLDLSVYMSYKSNLP
jgi:hypothetical protein